MNSNTKNTISQQIKQVLEEVPQNSQELLDNFQTSPDEAVHEVRKNTKKLRALLKILRPFLPRGWLL